MWKIITRVLSFPRAPGGGHPLGHPLSRLIEKTNPEWKDLFFEIGGTEEMLDADFPLR